MIIPELSETLKNDLFVEFLDFFVSEFDHGARQPNGIWYFDFILNCLLLFFVLIVKIIIVFLVLALGRHGLNFMLIFQILAFFEG